MPSSRLLVIQIDDAEDICNRITTWKDVSTSKIYSDGTLRERVVDVSFVLLLSS